MQSGFYNSNNVECIYRPPQPFGSWTGTYNATKMRQRCPQTNMTYYPPLMEELLDSREDQEDCLTINVFTPKIPRDAKDGFLPVMFYLHGGSFYLGSAHDFFPDFLLEKDIVLAVIQYRLGVLGFANLGSDDAPGNAGLLDVIEALKWVQKYIQWFGGDPRRVTVVGQSAGSAAASALLISPPAQNLFAQMILQSGSVLSNWAFNEHVIADTLKLACSADCCSNNTKEVAECLAIAHVEDIINAHLNYMEKSTLEAFVLGVQKSGDAKAIIEKPIISFEEGSFTQVPIMAGMVRDDGTGMVSTLYEGIKNFGADFYSRQVSEVAFAISGLEDGTGALVDTYQKKYFSNARNFATASAALIDVVGTFHLKAPTVNIARRMSKFKPAYLYSFNFKGNVSKLLASEPDWDEKFPFPAGVAHSDELGYLFPSFVHNYSAAELRMSKVMVELWTNFIIYGKPNSSAISWKPMTNEFGPYLRIQEKPEMRDDVFLEYEVTQREGFIRSSAGISARPVFVLIIFLLFLG